MGRVAGVNLKPHQHVVIALRGIFGVGPTRAKAICAKVGIEPASKVSSLGDDSFIALQNAVNDYIVEGDLRREVGFNIKRLRDIKSYRGLRHKRKLPCRGQRTKTNARTRKGRKVSKGGTKK
ncbi:MAG: 30S ribosomal protein S13 [Legionellales bacterium]|nr:MAG: 30S ribosomal protein S13 [Legionellales bacterium]